MTKISLFSFTDYKDRIPSLYPFSLAEDCKTVTDCIYESGSVVRDSLVITNPMVSVPHTISNTAIFFACIELFGHAPIDDIKTEGREKIFSIAEI